MASVPLLKIESLIKADEERQALLLETLRKLVSNDSDPHEHVATVRLLLKEESLQQKERHELVLSLLEAKEAPNENAHEPYFEKGGTTIASPRSVLRREHTVIAAADEWSQDALNNRTPTPVNIVAASSWQITDPSDVEINTDKILGSGAYGTVFLGKFRGKEVAVKKLNLVSLDDSEEMEFVHEIEVMASLRHPNLLLLMGACLKPGNMLMVTELMGHGSVYSLLHPPENRGARAKSGADLQTSFSEQRGATADVLRLSFKRRMLFAKCTAQGMNALHLMSPPLLHRDLKTANLLVDENWVVKVADFGLAMARKIMSSDGDSATAKPVGSPLYMAPEVLNGRTGDTKSDVYSFGLCLWELATERDPWDHLNLRSARDIMKTVVTDKLRPPLMPTDVGASFPEGSAPLFLCRPLVQCIERCWADDPEQRPTFESMLKSNVFDDIILEQLISDAHSGARRFWVESFSPGAFVVKWEKFIAEFLVAANYQADTEIGRQLHLCLFELLRVKAKDGEFVSIENFGDLLEWFGPWNLDSSTAKNVAARILELLKNPWFHGFMDSNEAKELLITGGNASKPKKVRKGSFLIRFSATEPGTFAIGVVRNEKTQHVHHGRISRLAENRYKLFQDVFASLDDLIRACTIGKTTKFKLTKPVECATPFTKIFMSSKRLQPSPAEIAMSYYDLDTGCEPP